MKRFDRQQRASLPLWVMQIIITAVIIDGCYYGDDYGADADPDGGQPPGTVPIAAEVGALGSHFTAAVIVWCCAILVGGSIENSTPFHASAAPHLLLSS